MLLGLKIINSSYVDIEMLEFLGKYDVEREPKKGSVGTFIFNSSPKTPSIIT